MLKRQIFIALTAIFCTFTARAQLTPINGTGSKYKGLQADSLFNIPNRCDTLFSAAYQALIRPGSTFWNSCENDRWVYKNDHWARDSALSGAGGTGSAFSLRYLGSSSFSDSVDCPLPMLNGDSIQVFSNDLGRFLVEGVEWVNLAGGGFTIKLTGWNATHNSYSLSVYANNIASPPGPQPFGSSSFTTAVDAPLPQFNGMTLRIYWNDAQRWLTQGVEFNPYAGGGFTITLSGFNALVSNYSFYIFAQ